MNFSTSRSDSLQEKDAFPVDPLLCDFALPLQGTFYPFGFPLLVSTNCGEVLSAAEESWGSFPRRFSESAVALHIAVSDDDRSNPQEPPVFRGRGHLVSIIADRSNFFSLDLRQGVSFGWITRSTLKNRPLFRYHFLEGTALTALESLYLTSLHAACVSWGGHGVLLCGDAGAGKSSLAFACARKGWTFISDDGSSIVRNQANRTVLGNPYQMRFRADAPNLFPELASQALVRGLDGELAIELPTSRCPAIPIAFDSHVDYVVFLNRYSSGPARLLHYSPDSARSRLERTICFGDEEVRTQQKASLQRILSAQVLELRYSGLDSGVACLRELASSNLERPDLPAKTVNAAQRD